MKARSPEEIPQQAEIIEIVEKEGIKGGFAELLTIPEGSSLPVEIREDLQKAANDITAFIYSPLRAGENTLNQKHISPATRELFAEPVERARQSLELFESVLNDLKGKGENIASSVILTAKEKSETETVFLITPNTESFDYKKGQTLGQIGETKVRKVEIVVKTAESGEEQTYTPQTIKFIAQDKKGKQIENFRIEVHSTQKRSDKPQYVQVDADIGGKRLAKTHLDVESLGKGEEALNNFRILQYAFLVNFAERVAAAESLSLDFENEGHRQRFEKIAELAKQNLGIKPEAKEMTAKIVEKEEVDEEMVKDLRQATGNVSQVLIKCLRDVQYNLWGIKENGVDDADIVLCALFELEPHAITKQEFISLNGKVPKTIEALTNFSTLQKTDIDQREHLILARAGEYVFDHEDPDALIVELEKLATVQDLIKK